MKTTALLLTSFLSSFFLGVASHTTVWYVHINGKNQGKFTGIRRPDNAPGVNYNNSPVKDLNSQAMAGDSLTFEWRHDKELSQGDDIIPSSHRGPVMAYFTSSITNINGQGVWTKIYDDGFNGNWATEKLIQNKGSVSVKIPPIKPGKYLFKSDLIGLHEADVTYSQNKARGAQLYPNCIQINIVNGGTSEPPGGVSFPGTITYNTPGIVFDSRYPSKYASYPRPAPGGALWKY